MRYKHILISFFTVLCMFSTSTCSTVKNTPVPSTAPAAASATTQLFLQQLHEDMQKQKPRQYRPSPDLAGLYGIHNINNQYYIRGFLMLQEGYSAKDLDARQCTVHTDLGSKLTVEVNILQLESFLNDPKIKYFDISIPAHTNF